MCEHHCNPPSYFVICYFGNVSIAATETFIPNYKNEIVFTAFVCFDSILVAKHLHSDKLQFITLFYPSYRSILLVFCQVYISAGWLLNGT